MGDRMPDNNETRIFHLKLVQNLEDALLITAPLGLHGQSKHWLREIQR